MKFILSFLLMIASVCVMQFEVSGNWGSFGISMAITGVIILINIGSVIDIVKLLLDKFMKKRGQSA